MARRRNSRRRGEIKISEGRGRGFSSVVERLRGELRAPSSIPSTPPQKKINEGRILREEKPRGRGQCRSGLALSHRWRAGGVARGRGVRNSRVSRFQVKPSPAPLPPPRPPSADFRVTALAPVQAPAPARAPVLTPASAAPTLEEELQEAIRRAQVSGVVPSGDSARVPA